MAVMPYEGLYVGFPALYNPAGPDGEGNNTGLNQVELTVSRDMLTWDRVADRELFIGIDPWDGVNYGTAQNLMSGCPHVRGDEIWVYYNALRFRAYSHQHPELDPDYFRDGSALCLAKLRLDGFVSLDAAEEGFGPDETIPLHRGRPWGQRRGPRRASRRADRPANQRAVARLLGRRVLTADRRPYRRPDLLGEARTARDRRAGTGPVPPPERQPVRVLDDLKPARNEPLAVPLAQDACPGAQRLQLQIGLVDVGRVEAGRREAAVRV